MLAGSSSFSPNDSPSSRVVTDARLDHVASLYIESGGSQVIGTGVLIAPDYLLTAAHNFDFNGDGILDAELSATSQFNLSIGTNFQRSVLDVTFHADFTGFSNPNVNDDLALVRLESAYSGFVAPTVISTGKVGLGSEFWMAGYGRSGSGDSGYTLDASTSIKREGGNVIDSLLLDDEGALLTELFEYDFDHPTTVGLSVGSLGNDVESLIGPGDSGGGAYILVDGEYQLIGINTYTISSTDGRFGSRGGGVILDPYHEWIEGVTGIQVPEPAMFSLILSLFIFVRVFSMRKP